MYHLTALGCGGLIKVPRNRELILFPFSVFQYIPAVCNLSLL